MVSSADVKPYAAALDQASFMCDIYQRKFVSGLFGQVLQENTGNAVIAFDKRVDGVAVVDEIERFVTGALVTSAPAYAIRATSR